MTRRLLAIGAYIRLSARFESIKARLFAAAALVVVGIVIFLVTVSASSEDEEDGSDTDSTATPAIQPARAALVESDGPLAEVLGDNCPTAFEVLVISRPEEHSDSDEDKGDDDEAAHWTLAVTDPRCNRGEIEPTADEVKILMTHGG